jgi:hypothetical protein
MLLQRPLACLQSSLTVFEFGEIAGVFGLCQYHFALVGAQRVDRGQHSAVVSLGRFQRCYTSLKVFQRCHQISLSHRCRLRGGQNVRPLSHFTPYLAGEFARPTADLVHRSACAEPRGDLI